MLVFLAECSPPTSNWLRTGHNVEHILFGADKSGGITARATNTRFSATPWFLCTNWTLNLCLILCHLPICTPAIVQALSVAAVHMLDHLLIHFFLPNLLKLCYCLLCFAPNRIELSLDCMRQRLNNWEIWRTARQGNKSSPLSFAHLIVAFDL